MQNQETKTCQEREPKRPDLVRFEHGRFYSAAWKHFNLTDKDDKILMNEEIINTIFQELFHSVNAIVVVTSERGSVFDSELEKLGNFPGQQPIVESVMSKYKLRNNDHPDFKCYFFKLNNYLDFRNFELGLEKKINLDLCIYRLENEVFYPSFPSFFPRFMW